MRDYLIIRTIAGIFFVLPCIETYQKVDLRTITLDVPPQEVNLKKNLHCWQKLKGTREISRAVVIFTIISCCGPTVLNSDRLFRF